METIGRVKYTDEKFTKIYGIYYFSAYENI